MHNLRLLKNLYLRSNFIRLLTTNALLAIGVFYFMGSKHTAIGFHSDDYGFIYNGTYKSGKDVKRIFNNGDMIYNANALADKETPPTQKANFLETLYRPLVLLIMGTEHKLLGLNAYRFHLVHAGLHTAVTLALFNTIAIFTSPLIALPAALFFGLHTSLKDYFFWQCYIQNTLEAALLCIIIGTFIVWRRNRSIIALITCLIIFFITLLLRETLVILPALACAWVLLERQKHSWTAISSALKTSLLFCIPIISYLLLRLWAHPFSLSGNRIGIKHFATTQHNFMQQLNLKFFDIVTWLIDLLGLKWLPQGTALIKLSVLIMLGWLIVTSWQHSTYKKYLFLASMAVLITSWPSLLLVHCSRYLYLPTLFFSFAIGLAIASCTKKIRPLIITIGLGYTMLQGYVTNASMTKWTNLVGAENKLIKHTAALSHHHQKLIILGYPLRLIGTGCTAGLRLYGAATKNIAFVLPYYTAWERGLVRNIQYRKITGGYEITAPTPATTWFSPAGIIDLKHWGAVEVMEQDADKIFSLNFKPYDPECSIVLPQKIFATSIEKGAHT